MPLNKLVKTVDRSAKRLGRGLASGKGKTAGRGTKGQKSRSGYNIPRRFEGGQTAMIQRLPKVRGFKSRFPKPAIVNLLKIEERFAENETVSFKTLIEKGLIKNALNGVKIIGAKTFTKKLKFRDVVFSKTLADVYALTTAEAPVKTEAKVEKPAKAEKTVKETVKKASAKKEVAKKAPAKKATTKKS
jgi:large subunit ribosomal protein L15